LKKAANVEDSILLEGHGSVDEIKSNYYKDEMVIGVTDQKGVYSIKIPSDGLYKETQSSLSDFPENNLYLCS